MGKTSRVLISLLIFTLVIFLNITPNLNQSNYITYNKDIIYEATYLAPSNLQELKQNSKLIVKGVYIGIRETNNDKNLIGPSSISKFEVEEVYKGSIDSKIISVIEPCKFENGSYSNVDGYVPMRQGNEYMLYLKEISTELGKQYTITLGNFGKYNLSNSTSLLLKTDIISNFNQVSDLDMVTKSIEKCELYNKIKSEITNQIIKKSSYQTNLLQTEEAFYNFRMNPSDTVAYYLDKSSTDQYPNHTQAYINSINKYQELQSTNIGFTQVNKPIDATVELLSVDSPKEEWLGISKISYVSDGKYDKVSKARVYLNQYNIVVFNLTKDHVYEVALHEMGHCFGLEHQDQAYAN